MTEQNGKIIFFLYFSITENVNFDDILSGHGCKANRNDYAGQWYPHILKLFASVLRKGLGNRIHSLTPLPIKYAPWNVTEVHPKMVKSLSFGIKLNIDNCLDVLVKGPQANNDEAEGFKMFWGNKSELRRFQDG